MVTLAEEIRTLTTPVDNEEIQAEVERYLDLTFPDIQSLYPEAGPSSGKRPARNLDDEIKYWKETEEASRKQLEDIDAALPDLIERTQSSLRDILSRAQTISLDRYGLADGLNSILAEIGNDVQPSDDGQDGDEPLTTRPTGPRVIEQFEDLHADMARSQAALAWINILRRVLALRDTALDSTNHVPSALAALPHYRSLHETVVEMECTLPAGMTLLTSIRTVREKTWAQLKHIMSSQLVSTSEPLKWPLRVDYASVSAPQRRAFERAFVELLYLQAEGDRIRTPSDRSPSWTTGEGLYPFQALVEPIALRFKYHFQGTRNTNRVDKPEWAFANILDTVFEHQTFLDDYLRPLVSQAGFAAIDVKSEFTCLLFPILLGFLRSRIPHLLSHPALLAHTIYQTVLFDDAIRETGFDLRGVSAYRGIQKPQWEGLAGVVLRESDWFQQWLAGEKKFTETQFNEIISSSDAWTISDETNEDDNVSDRMEIRSTESARQVRALNEQITDRYAPLPALEFRIPFLSAIQLPLLSAYLARISGSLDAFESHSSAFVRAVPGALAGNVARSVTASNSESARLTVGPAGLERLLKAHVSAEYILAALSAWSDDVLFAEMSSDIAGPEAIPTSVWDPTTERFDALRSRAEDMMVRLVSSEVESDLRPHLTRRWDPAITDELQEADASLVAALTSFTALISLLAQTLPRPAAARVYRRVVAHLSNHIQQRAVYAGWSKFTALGGCNLVQEVNDWRHAATAALAPALRPIPADQPWVRLSQIATVLALPAEGDERANPDPHAPTFAQAMAAAWNGGAALESFCSRAGIDELNADDLQAILRRRIECWR